MRLERAEFLPARPATRSEVTAWDLRNARSLCEYDAASDDEVKARLCAVLYRGIRYRTIFNGADCAREALERQVDMFASLYGWPSSDTAIHVESTTDIGALQSDVLTEYSLLLILILLLLLLLL